MSIARKAALAVTASVAALLLVAGAAWWAIEGDGNVHVLQPGIVIRSAEPTPERLAVITPTPSWR